MDLIVVLDTDEDIFDATAEVRMAVRDFHVAKDILVQTPKMYQRELGIYWTISSQAQREGRVLYAKAS